MDKTVQLLRPVNVFNFEADNNPSLTTTDNELCEFICNKFKAKVGDVVVIDNDRHYVMTTEGCVSINQ